MASNEMSSTAPPAQPNIIQRLPAELRNCIYELLVVPPRRRLRATVYTDDRPIKAFDMSKQARVVGIEPSQPALSRVNRHLRREVLAIFYTRNTFVFQPSSLFKPFAAWSERLFNPARLSCLARIVLTKRVNNCIGGHVTRRHGHLYSVQLLKRDDDSVLVTFDNSAAEFCACVMNKACNEHMRKTTMLPTVGHRRDPFVEMVKDVEHVAMADFGGMSCAFVLKDRRAACETCGRIAGTSQVGKKMLNGHRRICHDEWSELLRRVVARGPQTAPYLGAQ